MIWIILAVVAIIVLYRFFKDLGRDSADLRHKSLSQKFSIIVDIINEAEFNGEAEVVVLHWREFNLFKEGSNQIVHFLYSTGHLTITWRYNYYQKEIVHEEFLENVRNLSLIEQQKLGSIALSNAQDTKRKHRHSIDSSLVELHQSYFNELINSDSVDRNSSAFALNMEKLALDFECSILNVKETYFLKLALGELVELESSPILKYISLLKTESEEESKKYNVKIENTKSGILYNWAAEYFADTIKKYKEFQEIFSKNFLPDEYFRIGEEHLYKGKIYLARIYINIGVRKCILMKSGLYECLSKCHPDINNFHVSFFLILQEEVYRTKDFDLSIELSKIFSSLKSTNYEGYIDLPF